MSVNLEELQEAFNKIGMLEKAKCDVTLLLDIRLPGIEQYPTFSPFFFLSRFHWILSLFLKSKLKLA